MELSYSIAPVDNLFFAGRYILEDILFNCYLRVYNNNLSRIDQIWHYVISSNFRSLMMSSFFQMLSSEEVK